MTRRLALVRLESDVEELETHNVFVEVEAFEERRRRAMVDQLRVRVREGRYQPNLRLIAERMLADR